MLLLDYHGQAAQRLAKVLVVPLLLDGLAATGVAIYVNGAHCHLPCPVCAYPVCACASRSRICCWTDGWDATASHG